MALLRGAHCTGKIADILQSAQDYDRDRQPGSTTESAFSFLAIVVLAELRFDALDRGEQNPEVTRPSEERRVTAVHLDHHAAGTTHRHLS